MKNTVIKSITDALHAMGVEGPLPEIELEVPREEAFGDLASPIAMHLARKLRKAPKIIAEEIVKNIQAGGLAGDFSKVEVAGAGFINFTLSPAYLGSQVSAIITGDKEVLRSNVGQGRRIQVEFVSANPTGPLHLGHGRGAAVGAALCNILSAAGYQVEREYYVNDAGRQVGLLGQSVFARYQGLFAIECPLPEDGYQGQYVEDAARAFKDIEGEKYKGARYEDVAEPFVEYSLRVMVDLIKRDLLEFNVLFDTWQSERALYKSGAVQHAIEYLKGKGLMYEEGGALWFRSTDFGDDKDRVVIKQDGQPTYFASDIAYHLNKVERGFDELIDIWGADHHGYIPRLGAVMDGLGKGREKLTVLLIQMVSLMRGGLPVQMSKRAGTYVTLKELIEEVGADITKFIFLTRRHDTPLAFDLDAAKAQSSDNPVFYVQYANARINSIFKKALSEGVETGGLEGADFGLLKEEEELRLMRKLLGYRVAFESAAKAREPHRVTFYLQELAGMFHPFYNKHRVLVEDRGIVRARLALCQAVQVVLKDGLELLGLSAPDKM